MPAPRPVRLSVRPVPGHLGVIPVPCSLRSASPQPYSLGRAFMPLEEIAPCHSGLLAAVLAPGSVLRLQVPF